MPSDYVIISMTTIPPRFGKLTPVLRSLLNQTIPADEIILYIPKSYERFGNYDAKSLAVPDGVAIRIVQQDFGPATKILPCVDEFKSRNPIIVYCDDDRIFAPTWLESLVSELKQRPDHVVTGSGAHLSQSYQIKIEPGGLQPRAQRKRVKYDFGYLRKRLVQFMYLAIGRDSAKPHRNIYKKGGYVDIAMGVGGVALYPSHMPKLAFNIPDIAWPVDDIWLSGCFTINSVPIWASEKVLMPIPAEASDIESLASSYFKGMGRHELDRACINYFRTTYGIWK